MSPYFYNYFVSENTLKKKHIFHYANSSGFIWQGFEISPLRPATKPNTIKVDGMWFVV